MITDSVMKELKYIEMDNGSLYEVDQNCQN